MITFGMYRLHIHDTKFEIYYGAWPSGYYETAHGQISEGLLCIHQRSAYHTIPKRVIIELQKRFNPRIKHDGN